jgi:hypothetical protein
VNYKFILAGFWSIHGFVDSKTKKSKGLDLLDRKGIQTNNQMQAKSQPFNSFYAMKAYDWQVGLQMSRINTKGDQIYGE